MDQEIKNNEIVKNTSQLIMRKGEHPKFIDCTVMMLSANILPYYAEFQTFLNYYETNSIPTCGVNVSKEGCNFYWNREFVDSLLDTEALFLLLHEDFHLLFDHTKRSIMYNKEFSNIAQDMIINQIIHDEIMSNDKNKGKVTIPKSREEFLTKKDGTPVLDKNGNPIKNPFYNKNMGLFIPVEYKGEHIFENLYEWLKDKYAEYKNRKEKLQNYNNKSQSQDQNQEQSQDKSQEQKGGQSGNSKQKGGKGKGENDDIGQGGQQPGDQESDQNGDNSDIDHTKDSFGKDRIGNYGQNNIECQSLDSIFDSMERGEKTTLDSHIDDDVPEDARKSMVNDFMQRLKNRGLVTSDVEKILNKLRKSKHDYLKEIKRTISHHVFGTTKRKSITKPNRRGIEGIKGKKKFKNVINCVLDTSGSMSGDFESVLSYVFQNDIHINLIQIDTQVKAVEGIKTKKDLEKLVIKGLGGTTLQPALDYISEPKNKLFSYNTVMLTDGECDHLDFSMIKGKTLILTTRTAPRINDPKGIVKIIEIDVENSLHSN